MVRHPHTLHVLSAAESEPDASGHYAAATDSWVKVGVCREQTSSHRREIVVDGQATAYRSVVHLPGAMPVRAGDRVQVRQGTSVRVEGTVIRTDYGQISARLWL